MRKYNDSQTSGEMLQNRFTAYLTAALQNCRYEYMEQLGNMHRGASMEEYVLDYAHYHLEDRLSDDMVVTLSFEDDNLFRALKALNERERRVFFGRVLDERSFEDLAQELGLSYKGAAAIYYRTIQKLRKELRRVKYELF